MCMSGLYMDTHKHTGFVWVNSPGAATNTCASTGEEGQEWVDVAAVA